MAKRSRDTGFTLIEVVVVIAIMAATVGLGLNLFGGSANAQIKKETSHLIRTIQFAYNDATARRFPLRVVFDIDNGEYWLESGEEGFLLENEEAGGRERKREREKPAQPGKEAEEGESGEGAEAEEVPAFSVDDAVIKKVKLPKILKIRDVYVAHQDSLAAEGQAFLYFFPSGRTEHAVIHLSDEDEELNYTVIVNPVTGRSRVETEYVEYERVLGEAQE